MKTCRDCLQELPLSDFRVSGKSRDGRTSYCRACFRVRDATYRAARAAELGRVVRPRPVLPDGQARCPSCDTVKAVDEFGTRTGGRAGRVSYCYPCFNRIKVESRQRVHGGSRNYHLLRRYGISAAEVDDMVKAQGGGLRPVQGTAGAAREPRPPERHGSRHALLLLQPGARELPGPGRRDACGHRLPRGPQLAEAAGRARCLRADGPGGVATPCAAESAL